MHGWNVILFRIGTGIKISGKKSPDYIITHMKIIYTNIYIIY